MELFLDIFSATVLLSIALIFSSILLLRFTLDRRVRNSLPKDKVYDSYMDFYFGFGRSVTFAWCAIIPNKKHADIVSLYYDGMNIYKFSKLYEKIFAFMLLFGCILLFAFCGTIYLVTDIFGIVDWQ